MWTENFQMFKLDLEKAEEPKIKLPTSLDHQKSQQSSRKASTFALFDYVKTFDYIDYSKLWKIGVGIPDHLICLLRNLMQVKKQQLELDMEQQTGSK